MSRRDPARSLQTLWGAPATLRSSRYGKSQGISTPSMHAWGEDAPCEWADALHACICHMRRGLYPHWHGIYTRHAKMATRILLRPRRRRNLIYARLDFQFKRVGDESTHLAPSFLPPTPSLSSMRLAGRPSTAQVDSVGCIGLCSCACSSRPDPGACALAPSLIGARRVR